MKRLTLIAASVGLTLMSAPIHALTVEQTLSTAPPAPRRIPRVQPIPLAGEVDGLNVERRDEFVQRALENTSPARLDRAERIAELINSGDCVEASALVSRENDRRLARRVAEVCQSRN